MAVEIIGEGPIAQVVIALGILIIGHASAKIVSRILKSIFVKGNDSLTKKRVERRLENLRYLNYVIDSGAVILALIYLNAGINSAVLEELLGFIPDILSAILVVILGFLVINITTKIGSDFLKNLGVRNYFNNIGLSEEAFNFVGFLLKGFLYLILLQITLAQLGIGDTFVSEMVTASSWAAAFLIAGLLFYGFKDLFQNYAAGIYLKNSRMVRPGKKVYFGDEKGEITNIDLFSTQIDSGSGYTLVAQNKEIVESKIKFRRTKGDIETLEDIKKYFTAQDPSYCGPASAEMALSIFGYSFDQEKIGELAETKTPEEAEKRSERGTSPDKLIEAIEEVSEGEVNAAYVEYDKISDLSDETKAWLKDGGLTIPNFAKKYLFPEAETAHYTLCVGVEEDELLIVDPSMHTVSGGVYYADASEMLEAMGEFEGRTRGYIVMAPEGTTAYWRIEKGLIYSDKTVYEKLNKNLELQLRRIMREGRVLKKVLPEQLQDYIDRWEAEDKVNRLWEGESQKDE